jgi:N-acetylated-alpha-linked acidic dipeptidase
VSGGRVSIGGCPSLRRLVEDVLKALPGEEGSGTLFDLVRGTEPSLKMGLLGGGSDFAVFQNHLGIPCLDLSSGGPYGVYHSGFDTFGWMKKAGDPDFRNHARMALLLASLIHAAADAPFFPYDFGEYGEAMLGWLEEIEKLDEALDFAVLTNEVRSIVSLQSDLDKSLLLLDPNDPGPKSRPVGRMLLSLERSLLHETGVPSRPFQRHAIFAPDNETGYGTTTFPLLREAVLSKNRDAIVAATAETARVLGRLKAGLSSIIDFLEAAKFERKPPGPAKQ